MRKRRRNLIGSIILCLCAVGIAQILSENRTEEEIGQSEQTKSTLTDISDCRLCGNADFSLSTLFQEKDALGVICVNNWSILEMDILKQDEEKAVETEGQTSISTVFSGEEECTFREELNQERRVLKTEVKYGTESAFDKREAEKRLCQNCLEKLLPLMQGYGKEEDVLHDLCLIDFQTMELYSLQGNEVSYYIRDYYVQAENSREGMELLAVYVPKER